MLDIKQIEQDMEKAVDHLVRKMASLRSARVSSNLLDDVEIEQHGAKVLLKHISMVGVLDSRSLKIDLFDQSAQSQVKQAIREKLQLEATELDTGLKVTVPPMTEERQKQLVKQARDYAESEKVVVRNVRRNGFDLIKKIKKDENISEDDEKKLQKDIDKIHDKYIKQIEALCQEKEKTILG